MTKQRNEFVVNDKNAKTNSLSVGNGYKTQLLNRFSMI